MKKLINWTEAVVISLVVLVIIFLYAADLALLSFDRRDCADQTGNEAISSCTRLINRNLLTEREKATAMARRGLHHVRIGNELLAIADIDRALLVDRKSPSVFSVRGQFREHQGDIGGAIREYSTALSLVLRSESEQKAHEFVAERLEYLKKTIAEKADKLSGSSDRLEKPLSPTGARRIAVIIGIAEYKNLSTLNNPALDAVLVSSLMQEHGFDDVRIKLNIDYSDFEDVLMELNTAALGADEVLFYFAGHGMRVAGRDLLAPRDFQYVCPEDEFDPKRPPRSEQVNSASRGIDIESQLLPRLPAAARKIIVIDSCRNAPFARCKTRGGGSAGLVFNYRSALLLGDVGGLDPVIFSSTRPGALASDGAAGQNSPFAKAFVANLAANPNRMWQRIMNEVAVDVSRATQGSQTPVLVSGNAPASCLAGVGCRWE